MKQNITIDQVFCHECNERLQRVGTAFEQYSTKQADHCYRLLLQEFDSLYGASRAANFPTWEDYSQEVGALLVDLRSKLPTLDLQGHMLLEQAMKQSLFCAGDPRNCLERRRAVANQIISDIRAYMGRE